MIYKYYFKIVCRLKGHKFSKIMLNQQLKNPFATSRKSNEEFGLLALSHIKYLEVQNKEGAYSKFLEMLNQPYQDYRDWLSKQETSRTNKKGITITLNDVMQDVEAFSLDLYEVAFVWKRKKPEAFNALFPHGKSEYATMSKTNAETILKRLSNACNENKELDQSFKTKAAELLTNFVAARKEQLGQKGDVKEGSEDGRDLRLLLAKNMFLVFLELLIMNIDDTEKVKTFYDTQLISSRTTKKKVAEKPTK